MYNYSDGSTNINGATNGVCKSLLVTSKQHANTMICAKNIEQCKNQANNAAKHRPI